MWDYLVWLKTYIDSMYDKARAYARAIGYAAARALINSEIGRVYHVVSGWLKGQYNSIKVWVLVNIQGIRDRARAAWDWVLSAYSTVSDWIRAKTAPIFAAVNDRIDRFHNLLTALGVRTYNRVVAWVSPFFSWFKQQLGTINNKLNSYRKRIDDLSELFSSITKERFTVLFDDGWALFSSFLFQPLKFILALIKPILIDLICYSFAYALGTVEKSLPPWPNWDQQTYYDDEGRPSPAPSGLIPPLANMYVSGYRFQGSHKATDYGCMYGCAVFACHSGVVEAATYSTVGYGIFVTIRGDDWWTRYAHLMQIDVAVGQRVSAGQVIGGCDSTGNSTGNHLHLEIKYKGSFINPETVF